MGQKWYPLAVASAAGFVGGIISIIIFALVVEMANLGVLLISIVAGASGYLIANFVIRPILLYRDIKDQVASDLIFYHNAINPEGLNEFMQDLVKSRIEANRRGSSNLSACYPKLPSWYKRWLQGKAENPKEAATELMGLSNTFDFETANRDCSMFFIDVKSNSYIGTFGVVIPTLTLIS